MPLHFGKIFAFIALFTIAAFILWQIWVAFFVGETVEAPEPAASIHSVQGIGIG